MMTREQHLEFCRRCMNRKFDPAQGIICSITGNAADFDRECLNFSVDGTVKIEVDDQESLGYDEVKKKLPEEIYTKLRSEQNLFGAIVAGLAAAVLCAILWSMFTVTFEFQISYMAILVGVAVGFSMRKVGKGVDQIFGVFGAGISLLGCALGNFFSIIGYVAIVNELGYVETLTRFDYSQLFAVMTETFGLFEMIICTIAIVTGYKLAMRSITEKDIKTFKQDARSEVG